MKYFWQDLNNLYPELEFLGKSFHPTGTTQLIYEVLTALPLSESLDILELGCGSGVVTLGLNKNFKSDHRYHLSDISLNAIKVSRANLRRVNLRGDIRQSNIFENWENKKFDLIINDISGIAIEIGEKFSWFEYSVNDSGVDGTLLNLKVIDDCDNYLKENGSLVMPVISLSDSVKVIASLNRKFQQVKCLKERLFPLQQDEETIRDWLKKYDFIETKKIGPFNTFQTSIYLAKGLR